jgi:hypothetical protein
MSESAADDQHDVDFTGDEAEERAILCVPCRQYQQLNTDGYPECEHTISESKDISHLDALTWAYIRLRAYRRELEADEPFGSKAVLKSNIMSLVSDLAFAGEDVPEPDDIDSVIERRVSNAE